VYILHVLEQIVAENGSHAKRGYPRAYTMALSINDSCWEGSMSDSSGITQPLNEYSLQYAQLWSYWQRSGPMSQSVSGGAMLAGRVQADGATSGICMTLRSDRWLERPNARIEMSEALLADSDTGVTGVRVRS